MIKAAAKNIWLACVYVYVFTYTVVPYRYSYYHDVELYLCMVYVLRSIDHYDTVFKKYHVCMLHHYYVCTACTVLQLPPPLLFVPPLLRLYHTFHYRWCMRCKRSAAHCSKIRCVSIGRRTIRNLCCRIWLEGVDIPFFQKPTEKGEARILVGRSSHR